MLLVCFDLPRETKIERKQASMYRKRLIELGFSMKQYSLYEREVRSVTTRNNVIKILKEELPHTGMITLYLLPDEVNNQQITILGQQAIRLANSNPRLRIF